DWLALLSSAAIGSLLGLLAKEGIDWLRAERSHRLELRTRYFDAKLDATIRVIKQLKTATIMLRSFTTLVKENEETGGWIHPGLLNIVSQSWGRGSESVNEEAAGMVALIGFYYDDEVARVAETGGGTPTPLLQKFSEFFFHVEKSIEAQNVLNQTVPPPPDLREVAEKARAFHDQQVTASIGDLAKLADALDELANRLVRRMRDDYKGIRF
ncbi:MAG: hypothetical protein QOE82_1912, partial [Thermoanaerobaculia bacterium]|nr:hypothetical protein [Thermoanaerobaculia bacterium]